MAFSKEWVIDNLLAELVFGVIFLGLLAFMWRYAKDVYRAFKVFRIISTHNNPTRTRRKGFYCRCRFLDIYEAGRAINSKPTAIYDRTYFSGAFSEEYVDKGVLEHHGLVQIKNSQRGTVVEAKKNRFSALVYRLTKWAEERERKSTERFVLDKSGKLRRYPDRQ